MTLATTADFTERHGALDTEDIPKVAALLTDASALILAEVDGSKQTWVTDQTQAPDVVTSVCVSVVYRAWTNPDALSQSSMADTSLSYVRGGSADALFLTAAERRLVRGAAGLSSVGSMTLVTPYSGDGEAGDLDAGDL